MPQEATTISTTTALKAGKVRLQEPVTVYATATLKKICPLGHPLKVHRVQAEKLIKEGKATKEAPQAQTKL